MKKTIAAFAVSGFIVAGCSKADEASPGASGLTAANLNTLAAVTTPSIPSGTFTITSYGGSTGAANNASAITSAINAASTAGGGTFSNGSRITVSSGNAFTSTYGSSNITGINTTTGAPL
ncbi:hypothetical protein HNQ91_002458 [Filimonas zeae]|uniref:Uncharacterized protein n=1 Tax=Filimonas zeae TaxID=1737353 RepID=A0A917MTS8_9BACT|nr:hypothetical protein [Filimonas zeae]MDR6339407.1 hypothetical protein [Filimonas zeae]GGH63736.1 hypothetical protein GCM10011379_14980 [Filimonas zeae]